MTYFFAHCGEHNSMKHSHVIKSNSYPLLTFPASILEEGKNEENEVVHLRSSVKYGSWKPSDYEKARV